MAVILTFYAFFALLGVGFAWFVFRRLRRFGQVPAGIAGLLCLALVVLCFPLPIHGGFTTLFEVMLSELGQQQQVRQQNAREERMSEFLDSYDGRFAGPLAYEYEADILDNWQRVMTEGGERGWLNSDCHLIWSRPFPWQSQADFTLQQPKEFCRQLAPEGYWSLPSTAEMALFWRFGGSSATGGPAINAASFSVNPESLQEIPSIHLGHNGRSALRCVARASGAPEHGYLDQDISRELWNRYQMAKTSGTIK